MITGGLLLTLLVAREVARASDRDGTAARVLQTLFVPLALGFVALLALRLVDLVVGGA